MEDGKLLCPECKIGMIKAIKEDSKILMECINCHQRFVVEYEEEKPWWMNKDN